MLLSSKGYGATAFNKLKVILPLEHLSDFPCTPHRTITHMLTIIPNWPADNNKVSPSAIFFLLLLLHLRHLLLTSAPDQPQFKWTMLHTSKKGMRSMGTSVSMARTVPAFFAALRIVGRGRGGTAGYTSASPKWTPTPASSSQLPSACSTWSIGYHISTFKSCRKSVISALLTEFLREMVS